MAADVPSRSGVVVSQAWWWGTSEGAGSLQSNETLMSSRVLVLTLLVITAAAVSSYLLAWRKTTGQRLPALPPGPTGLPLLGSLPFLGPNLQQSFADLARTYGPVVGVRLGTRLCVVVSSPAAAKEVLKDHDAVFAYRDVPAAAKVITYGGRDVAWNNDLPASWRVLRKMSVRDLLNSSTMNAFYSLRRSEVRRMARELYRRRGTPVKVGELSFLALLDVTTSMLWGSTVVGEERSRVGKEFREVINEMAELMGAPNVSDFIPALARFDLQKVERRMKRLRDWFDRIVDRIIDMRLKGAGVGNGDDDSAEGRRSSGAGKDFLQVMLDVAESAADANLTVLHIKAVLLDMVLGGTDTSSSTVEWAMAEMMRNREILRRAQEELDAVVGKDAAVEESHLPRLRFLDAVAKETLRLHPVLPLLIPRCAGEPCVVGGHYVPAGTRVLVNAWAIHRDPSSWEDPLEFKPERFLVDDGTKWDYHGGGGGGFRFLPFGSGRRICAGIPMAERMTVFLLAVLLHSFDWELPAGVEVDLTEALGIVLKMARPLTVIPTPRLSNLQLYT